LSRAVFLYAYHKQLTNHINKQSLKPMGRWDKSLRNSKKAVPLQPKNQKMLQSLQEKSYIQKDDAGQWRVFITPSV